MISKTNCKRVALSQPDIHGHEVSPTGVQSDSERAQATNFAPELKAATEVLENHGRKFSLDKLVLNSLGLISPSYLFTCFPRAGNGKGLVDP